SYGTYYQSAEGLKEEALKTALYNIIKGHTEYPYDASTGTTDVWDMIKQTDKDPNNPDNVILIYSGLSVNAAQEYNNATGWTREHVWAKSRGDFGTEDGPGTDAHHLRPEDDVVNSARNNRSFDNCVTCKEVVSSGVNTGSYFDLNLYTFEPRDAVKGDVARMIFYMATRYEGENGEPDLELTENILADSDKSPFHGRLSTLLEWNREDPVDDWERNRNEVIYTQFQHNRNPYIDIPDLVEYIWGNAVGLNWSSSFTTFPKDGETNVAASTSIRFVFSAAIRNIDDSEITNDNVSGLLALKVTNASGTNVPFTASISADKKEITLTPDADLMYLQTYYASIDAVIDANAKVNDFTEINFTTKEQDITSPTFTSSPLSGVTGISINSKIVLTYNEAIRNIDNSEITEANLANLFVLKENDVNGVAIDFTGNIDHTKKIITITPNTDLKSSQLYFASMNAVEDASNNATTASNLTYTTTADITAPTFASSPTNGSQNVAIDKIVTLTYSEPIRNIDDSEITNVNVADLLTLKETNSSGASIGFTASIDETKKIISITPNTEFSYGQLVYVGMARVEDNYDNASVNAEFNFTTLPEGTQLPFWTLDFETPGGYTTTAPEFSNGNDDYFTRTDGSNIGPTYVFTNRQGSYFFAAQDMDGGGGTIPQELNINDIDISGKTVSSFSVYLAEDAADDLLFDWDKTDFVKFQYDVDHTGVFKDLFWVCNNGSTYNTQPSIDANFDGIGDGTILLTPEFKKITTALNVSGTTLDIKVILRLDAGDEDIAIDDLSLMNDDLSALTDNIVAKEIRIYPNPGKGKFFVEMGNTFNSNTRIEVFNMIGIKVYDTRAQESITELDLSAMKQGIYFVRVDDGENVLTQKIIKQ
ncbi:MAG: endonuclease, partial [Bacteroidales bacterium]|nr:endonuclease [Bacteroidales bacterium]